MKILALKTLLANRFFSWTYAVFLVFPLLFEISYFSTPSTSTPAMSDKKQIAQQLFRQFSQLQQLEAQFPMLRQIFANADDATEFEQVFANLTAKMAKMQAAKTEQTTVATAMPNPNPEPRPDPNINKPTFAEALLNWARTQKINLPSSSILIKSALIKDKLSYINSTYPIIMTLRNGLIACLTEETMSISAISEAFKTCINKLVPEPNETEKLKEIFQAGRKFPINIYRNASEDAFKDALASLNISVWLDAEAPKEAPKVALSREQMTSYTLRLAVEFSDSLAKESNDTFLINTIEAFGICKGLLASDKAQLFAPLLKCIEALPNPISINDFHVAILDCRRTHYSPEALAKIPTSTAAECGYLLEFNGLGKTMAGSVIAAKYTPANTFNEELLAWARNNAKIVISQNVSPTEQLLIAATMIELSGQSIYLKKDAPLLSSIAEQWHTELSKYEKEKTVNKANMLKALSDIIKRTCKGSLTESPLKEQADKYKQVALPSIDTLLKCMRIADISPTSYCNAVQRWAESVSGAAASTEFKSFKVADLKAFMPELFSNKNGDVLPMKFIADCFIEQLATKAADKTEISKQVLAEVWEQTMSSLKTGLLTPKFNALKEAFGNDTIRICEFVNDLNFYLPAPDVLKFTFERSAIIPIVKYIVPNPNLAQNAPIQEGSSMVAKVRIYQVANGSPVPPIEIYTELNLSNIKFDFTKTDFTINQHQNIGFPKITSANATLANTQVVGAKINNITNLKLGEITMPKNKHDSLVQKLIFDLHIETPEYTLTKTKQGETTGWKAGFGTVLSVGGGAAVAGTALFVTNPVGWAALIAIGVGSIATGIGNFLSSDAKGDPEQYNYIISPVQLVMQVEISITFAYNGSDGVIDLISYYHNHANVLDFNLKALKNVAQELKAEVIGTSKLKISTLK